VAPINYRRFQAAVHQQLLGGLTNEASGHWGKPSGRNEQQIATFQEEAPGKERLNLHNRAKRKEYLATKSWADTIAMNRRLYPKAFEKTYLP
jgi:hypothetical protein